MSSACRSALLGGLLLAVALPAGARELRVCADPNNLPFSNEQGEGFENRIAHILAEDLGASLATTWWAQRRGFIRNTLKSGLCDVIPGVPANMEMLRTTEPYYRSTYVWVTRAGDGPAAPRNLDDPALRSLRIGVQLVGDDGSNTPPAHALARRGLAANLRGYTLYGDYAQPNPPARILVAVAVGELDIAAVWGPLAGYFAPRQAVPLTLAPIRPQADGPQLPMVFDISMGVRREDEALAHELDAALARNRPAIDAVLEAFGVPRLDLGRRNTGAAR
jgi:mxaJ protein